jgi:hypothetical protein
MEKGADQCEKAIHRSLGEGASASAGSAEDVKMPGPEARGASPLVPFTPSKEGNESDGHARKSLD